MRGCCGRQGFITGAGVGGESDVVRRFYGKTRFALAAHRPCRDTPMKLRMLNGPSRVRKVDNSRIFISHQARLPSV